MGRWRLNTCLWCSLPTWRWNILSNPRFSHEWGWHKLYLMDYRQEGVAIHILVKTPVDRYFMTATKSNDNSLLPTCDSSMGPSLFGGSHSNSWHSLNSIYIYDEAILGVSYGFSPLPHSSHHEPTSSHTRYESHDKNGHIRKENKGIIKITDNDNNPVARWVSVRLERRRDLGRYTF